MILKERSWEKMNQNLAQRKHFISTCYPCCSKTKRAFDETTVVVFLLLAGVCVLLSTTKLAALNNNGMSEDLNEVCKKSVPSWSEGCAGCERKYRTKDSNEISIREHECQRRGRRIYDLLNTFKRRDLLRRSLRHYASAKIPAGRR